MMKKMKETEMVRFLKDMAAMERHIKIELNQLQSQVESIEGAIERRNFPSVDYTDIRVQKDLETDHTLQVLLDAREDVNRELRNLELRRQELYQKEDQMHLVRRCLSRLPYDAQDILICSFIKGEGWRMYIRRKCICQSYYYKLRRDAVTDLCDIYNLEIEQMMFLEQKRLTSRRRRNQNSKNADRNISADPVSNSLNQNKRVLAQKEAYQEDILYGYSVPDCRAAESPAPYGSHVTEPLAPYGSKAAETSAPYGCEDAEPFSSYESQPEEEDEN